MSGLFAGTSLERPVTCPACEKPVDDCTCPRDEAGNLCRPADQDPRVRREKRRGKWMTVVTGLNPSATDLKALAKEVKNKCASGGTTTADGLEVQGDHRDTLVEMLKEKGYPAKPAGG